MKDRLKQIFNFKPEKCFQDFYWEQIAGEVAQIECQSNEIEWVKIELKNTDIFFKLKLKRDGLMIFGKIT